MDERSSRRYVGRVCGQRLWNLAIKRCDVVRVCWFRFGNMNPQAMLMRRLSCAMAVPSGGALVLSSSSVRIAEAGGRIGRGSWSRVGLVREFCGVRASLGREIEKSGGVAAVSSGRGSDYLPPRFR